VVEWLLKEVDGDHILHKCVLKGGD